MEAPFGYAFVNFNTEAAQSFIEMDPQVDWAQTQGFAALVRRYQNSPIMSLGIINEALSSEARVGAKLLPTPDLH